MVILNKLGLISFSNSFIFKFKVSPICTNIVTAFRTAEIVKRSKGCPKLKLKISIPNIICTHKKG